MRLALALVLWPTLPLPPAVALAQVPLGAAEFEARVEGRTLTYSYGGEPFGTEQYFPNRRVAWAFTGGACVYGRWYAQGASICFVYDNDPDPQCWQFFDEGGRLLARFMGDGSGDGGGGALSEVSRAERLDCPGPDVGA